MNMRAIMAYVEHNTKWETRDPNHLVAWYTERPCCCDYEYDAGDPQPSQAMPDWMLELRDHMMQTLNLPPDNPPNSVNMNWYKSGEAGIGAHSDDESLFQAYEQPAKIISFSCGAEREFEIYEWNNKSDEAAEEPLAAKLVLPSLSYMTMEGMFQRNYKHKVPLGPKTLPARLNMTWRWIVKHEPNCPLAKTNQLSVSVGGS